MKEVRDILNQFKRRRGELLALATLVRVQGSSYRRAGARMLIASDGKFTGSLSAGCLEEEVASAAVEVMRSGVARLMHFDTRRRFGCSGSIDILIERVREEFLDGLTRGLASRDATVTVATVYRGEAEGLGSRIVSETETGGTEAFLQELRPTLRLIIIGRDAESDPLERIAETAGWEAHVIESITEWQFEVDAWTAVIVKTHNFGRDCAALRYLLPLGLRYVGLLGPRRRRDELLNDVLDSGASINSELFAPAGLHLNADGAEEIALAVAAEIQAVFANASGTSLRDRKAPIHEKMIAKDFRAATSQR